MVPCNKWRNRTAAGRRHGSGGRAGEEERDPPACAHVVQPSKQCRTQFARATASAATVGSTAAAVILGRPNRRGPASDFVAKPNGPARTPPGPCSCGCTRRSGCTLECEWCAGAAAACEGAAGQAGTRKRRRGPGPATNGVEWGDDAEEGGAQVLAATAATTNTNEKRRRPRAAQDAS